MTMDTAVQAAREAREAFERLGATAEDATAAMEKMKAALDDPEFQAYLVAEVEKREALKFLGWFALGSLGVVLALALPWLLS